MMKSKALAALVLLTLALTACSSPSGQSTPAAAGKPFNFLYIGGLTGALASTSALELKGIQVGVDQLNKEGGILGRKVELTTLDSKSDATEAVSVLQKYLSSGKKPDLVRAATSSTEALALMPVLTRAKLPAYSGAGTSLLDKPAEYPYLKLVAPPFTRQVQMLETYVKNKGYQRVTVLAPSDASGDDTIAAVNDSYKGTGITVTAERYNTADIDLSVPYQRALASDPQAIYVNCLGAPCSRLVSARESVSNGTDVRMIGDLSLAAYPGGPAATAPASVLKNLFLLTTPSMVDYPAKDTSARFAAWYKGMTEQGELSGTSAPAIAYDGLMAWAAAAKDAGSTDPAKMMKSLNSMKFPAGYFTDYGKASVRYTSKSVFPQLPDDAFTVVEASVQKGGQYPPLNLYAFTK